MPAAEGSLSKTSIGLKLLLKDEIQKENRTENRRLHSCGYGFDIVAVECAVAVLSHVHKREKSDSVF